ncbi:hypothetical protein PP583_gp03 [Pseudoalteromonas phage HS6]|uniref:hypothetical protein n=1 Tax=Pseudoalteromonas phage HS6 TaxID=1357710 RepID=UPI00232942AD|nr:hypothetical protein PP583_gp03 [Pseudoalteromonas phage HS6]
MDIFIVLLLLCCVVALGVFSYRFYMLESMVKIPERHLQKITDESLIELCNLLKQEGVPKDIVELVRNRKLASRTSDLRGFTNNPTGEFIELIRGAEELIDRQHETGEDLSQSISALLKLAKINT